MFKLQNHGTGHQKEQKQDFLFLDIIQKIQIFYMDLDILVMEF